MTTESLLANEVDQVDERHVEVTRALEQFRLTDFDGARAALELARQADPQLPPAGLLMARMFFAAGIPNQARAELEVVSKDYPDDPGPQAIMGEIALSEGRFAEAELAFNKASELAKQIEASPRRKRNLIGRSSAGLAAVAEARRDWEAATKLLQPLVKEFPEDDSYALRLARSLFKQGDEKTSLPILKRVWEKDPETKQRPEIAAAVLYEEEGNLAKATELMKVAAERDQQREFTQRIIAQWALEHGEMELAQACADRALVISDSSIEARLLVALVARYRQDYATARQLLESVHLEAPMNLAAVIELAIVLGKSDRSQGTAIQYAQLANKLQPDLRQPVGRNAAIALAWLLFRNGGRPQAEKILQQTLAAGPVSVESSYLAAQILMPGNPDAAKQMLTTAINSGRVFPGLDAAKKLLSGTQ